MWTLPMTTLELHGAFIFMWSLHIEKDSELVLTDRPWRFVNWDDSALQNIGYNIWTKLYKVPQNFVRMFNKAKQNFFAKFCISRPNRLLNFWCKFFEVLMETKFYLFVPKSPTIHEFGWISFAVPLHSTVVKD